MVISKNFELIVIVTLLFVLLFPFVQFIHLWAEPEEFIQFPGHFETSGGSFLNLGHIQNSENIKAI